MRKHTWPYTKYSLRQEILTGVLNFSSTKTTQTSLGFFCFPSCFIFSQLHFRTAPNLLSFLKFHLPPFMTSAPSAINLNSYIHLHGIFFRVFSVSLSACLATLPTSRPPALQRVSTWLLPDKIYQSRLPGFLIHLNNITKSAIHTLFLIHSPLLASHAHGWSRAWATNHSVSGSLS